MLRRAALAVLALLSLVVVAPAVELDGRFPELADLPTAHTVPRATYSIGARLAPGGTLVGGIRVGVTDYLYLGVSYGARNVVGLGRPDWESRVEFDAKVRIARQGNAPVGLALGFDSRGYGRQFDSGAFEKASPGLFLVASREFPFSEHWEWSAGITRTMEERRARPGFFGGVSARFSQEFSVITELQANARTMTEEGESTTAYLNAGLRWFFAKKVQLDFLLRNLTGSRNSPEPSSRSIAFIFHDSF